MLNALVVDDDPVVLQVVSQTIEEEGFHVTSVKSLKEAEENLARMAPDLLLLDVKLPDGSGLELLNNLDNRDSMEVVLFTAHDSSQDSLKALHLGASKYLSKPVSTEQLKGILSNVTRNCELKNEVLLLRKKLRELGHFGAIVGVSSAMQRVYDQIAKVSPTEATALIIGESGTGKDLVAQTIHQFSRQHRGPYLPINCGAISPNLIESELFGHEKGSFTGAGQQHKGYFERADGGTLFLDEICEMPVELQAKLLRVLESGNVTRVGGDQPFRANFRLVAATNRSPQEAVRDGSLREDLFYRLSVFPIEVPPLRERRGDVEFLAGHFLAELNKTQGTAKKLAEPALVYLKKSKWPGNVRELKNLMHRAFILTENEITTEHLRLSVYSGENAYEENPNPELDIRVGMTLQEAEKQLIAATLATCDGNKKQAAETLGISLRTLYNRLKDS
jgi:DNA-binding NtrC family response regulator